MIRGMQDGSCRHPASRRQAGPDRREAHQAPREEKLVTGDRNIPFVG
jgi:hypothetical protein